MTVSAIDRLPHTAARALFRHHIENGIAVSGAMAVVALATGAFLGTQAAVLAAIGAMCVSIVDQPAPLGSKLRMMTAGLAGSTLVTLLAGLASHSDFGMAAVVALTALALGYATAFGRTALTLAITFVLALVIGLAVPAANPAAALQQTGLFALGGGAYLGVAMAAATVLARHDRRVALNEALLAFAGYMRTRAGLYAPHIPADRALGAVIEAHAALMDKLQAAREIIFVRSRHGEGPRLVSGMIALLDAYESVLAADADIDILRAAGNAHILLRIRDLIEALAKDTDAIALALVTPLLSMPACAHEADLTGLDAALMARGDAAEPLQATREKLARGADRIARLSQVLAEDAAAAPPPGIDVTQFLLPRQAFLATLWDHATLTSPVTRYALRLTLAMLAGYGITLALPGYIHGGWVLLTVALIMRASFAVTVQRRDDRLIGTLAGCAFAALLIPILPIAVIIVFIIIGVGLAHAYATVNYRVTSFAASTMALLLLHFLEPAGGFVLMRLIDTAIGAVLAMGFAFVLPSWEWRDVPRLVSALIAADRRFALYALSPAPDDQAYRLARKAALDAFTALATTARRLSSEPQRQARNFGALNALLAANYLFASDLVSVQSLLHGRGDELDHVSAARLLAEAAPRIDDSLSRPRSPAEQPPLDMLRRLSWAEFTGGDPLVALRRRLVHIEYSADKLAIQATRASQ